jgi:hypothetical protein
MDLHRDTQTQTQTCTHTHTHTRTERYTHTYRYMHTYIHPHPHAHRLRDINQHIIHPHTPTQCHAHQHTRTYRDILAQTRTLANRSTRRSRHRQAHKRSRTTQRAALTSNADMEIDHRVVAMLCVATMWRLRFLAIVFSPSFLSPTMKPLVVYELCGDDVASSVQRTRACPILSCVNEEAIGGLAPGDAACDIFRASAGSCVGGHRPNCTSAATISLT